MLRRTGESIGDNDFVLEPTETDSDESAEPKSGVGDRFPGIADATGGRG
jgi:hypothetical protein